MVIRTRTDFSIGELRSGIDVKTINDIVANAHHIFEEADLTEYVYDSAISAKSYEENQNSAGHIDFSLLSCVQ